MAKILLFPIYGNKLNYHLLNRNNIFNLRGKNSLVQNIDNLIFSAYSAAFQIKKNLFVWKKIAVACGAKLTYFLQPFAPWIVKNYSAEEELLFQYLDKKKTEIHSLMNEVLYREYIAKLQCILDDFCVPLHDANAYLSKEAFDNKWLFVDRVHLTNNANKLMAEFILNRI